MLDENRIPLIKLFEEKFLERTAEEWDIIFNEKDIVHDRLVHFRDISQNEQARANHFMEEVTFRNGEKAWLPRPCIVSKNLGIPEYKLAPIMGEHSEEILCELGYSQADMAALKEQSAYYGTEHKPLTR